MALTHAEPCLAPLGSTLKDWDEQPSARNHSHSHSGYALHRLQLSLDDPDSRRGSGLNAPPPGAALASDDDSTFAPSSVVPDSLWASEARADDRPGEECSPWPWPDTDTDVEEHEWSPCHRQRASAAAYASTSTTASITDVPAEAQGGPRLHPLVALAAGGAERPARAVAAAAAAAPRGAPAAPAAQAEAPGAPPGVSRPRAKPPTMPPGYWPATSRGVPAGAAAAAPHGATSAPQPAVRSARPAPAAVGAEAGRRARAPQARRGAEGAPAEAPAGTGRRPARQRPPPRRPACAGRAVGGATGLDVSAAAPQGPVASAGRYEALRVIGNGAYGTVFEARDRETNDRVALKRMRLDENRSDGTPALIIREVALLRGLDHPNVVQLKDQIIGATECQLIFEYVPGDLDGVLKGHRVEGTQLPMEKVLRYSQDLLNGLHACHTLRVVHRDLKPQNLLIHPVDGLKICDFGLARTFSPPGGNYTPQVITLWYRGPELLLGCPDYGPEVDIWSSGCIVAEMATGLPIFPGDSEFGTLCKIMQLLGSPTEATWPGFEKSVTYWRPSFPKWPPTDLGAIRDKRPEFGDVGMDLARSLLTMNPAARLTSRRAKDHAFFSDA